MDFLDKIFDEFNNNSISGLTDELKGLYIKYLCNKFKKNVIVVTNYYNLINNYFENSYFFPMDDFITTVLTTSSPDLMVKRLETLSLISNNNENKIVVTNLEGFLKFVPKKDNIVNQDIVIKINDNFKRTDLEMFELSKLYSEELTLLKDLNDYEFTKIEQKYEPMENRV